MTMKCELEDIRIPGVAEIDQAMGASYFFFHVL